MKDLLLKMVEGDTLSDDEVVECYDKLHQIEVALRGTGLLFQQTRILVKAELNRLESIITARNLPM